MTIDVLLLTGWGVGKAPLQPLAEHLTQLGYHVHLIALPLEAKAKQWLTHITTQLPAQSYWVGWSLGGTLLAALTEHHAERCLGLVTLASNPKFSSDEQWPAMPSDVFQAFVQGYKQAPEKTLQRFLQLVAQGCEESRSLVRFLQNLLPTPDLPALAAGLTLLAEWDVRQLLSRYQGRQLHILATQDALVPIACTEHLQQRVPHAQVYSMNDTGHGFPVQRAKDTALLIDDFIKQEVVAC